MVAIVVVGPKDLPRLMRTFGHYAGKLRRAAADFQRQFEDAMRETELEEVKKAIDSVRSTETVVDLKAPIDKPIMLPKPEARLARVRPTARARVCGGLRRTAELTRRRPSPSAPPSLNPLRPRPQLPRHGPKDTANPQAEGGAQAVTYEDIESTKAPLIEHLIELRRRLIWTLLAIFVAFLICLWFAKPIDNLLLFPYRLAAGTDAPIELIYTAPQEFFFTQVKLALFGAIFIAFPVIASQIYMFVAPGLYKRERKAFLPFLIATPILFMIGAALVYFVAMPLAMKFSYRCSRPATIRCISS